MPNHVTNRIIASPKVVDAITRVMTPEEVAKARADDAATAVRYKERTGNEWPYTDTEKYTARFVDFALVVPEPANIFRGGCDMKHPHVDENGVVYEHCWSDWNRNNWGTKWNGYETTVQPTEGDLCELRFDTAWSHPFPVVLALAAKFPDEEIKVWYADEDFGYNVGRYVITGDEVTEEAELSNTDEGNEIAAALKYGQTYAEVKAGWDEDDE